MTNDQVQAFENELRDLKAKYKIDINATIDFPRYKELPPEVKLALEVIRNHGAIYVLAYSDQKEN